MTDPREIAPGVWVSGQISADGLDWAAARGVVRIVNNRPDGEEPAQPSSAALEAGARALGLDYVAAPVRGMPGDTEVAQVRAALDAGGPVLMFCRSGMRSACAWAMAEAGIGRDPQELREAAAAAGYDLSRLPL